MSAKEPNLLRDYFVCRGDNRPLHEIFINVNPPPTQEQIYRLRSIKPPKAPPPIPSASKSPSFLTLKNIIMDDDSLSPEQKLGLIDKISNLY